MIFTVILQVLYSSKAKTMISLLHKLNCTLYLSLRRCEELGDSAVLAGLFDESGDILPVDVFSVLLFLKVVF